ncbi:XrtA system polysaccharide deacetylase [Emcibacter sp.]|uniref:XrtA system polysaccharide deacetylase n=1 Tax=Emcibacter sp. TaxID=1979954 RepID=UPI003A8EBB41
MTGRIRNAMTVDVEDYFQVGAFENDIRREDWDSLPCRVERNMDVILNMFDEAGTKATFFTLGWVAERYPAVVRRIVEEGHELASHGMAHWRVTHQSPEEFREDVLRSKKLLEDVGGCPIRGYRAASFSIGEKNLWALDILEEAGFDYSSSIYPIRHDHYGMPNAPRFAFRPIEGRNFLEMPVTTVDVAGKKIPCGGGGYFRLLPYFLSKWAMSRVNNRDDQSCIFYFHPWEIDPDQPRQEQAGLKSRFRHYTNLDVMEKKLRRALADFSWGRMDEIFLKN